MMGLELDIDPVLQEALLEVARRKWLLRSIQAQKEQDQAAREGWLQARAIDGMGEVTRRVHAFAYHDWAQKLGSYDCWKDKGFNRYMDRIAPETRVRCQGTRTQVGWRAHPEEAPAFAAPAWQGEKRFSKTYPAAS